MGSLQPGERPGTEGRGLEQSGQLQQLWKELVVRELFDVGRKGLGQPGPRPRGHGFLAERTGDGGRSNGGGNVTCSSQDGRETARYARWGRAMGRDMGTHRDLQR